MNKKNMNKGITLIALVITIIVLLILAGVSITMLSGGNSILKQAGNAKVNTEEKQITERVQLAYLAALSTGKGSITEQLLKDELDKEFGENGYELTTDDSTEEWVVEVKDVERLRVKKSTTVASTPTTPTLSTGAGLQSDGSFIGLKSIGKIEAGEIDNYWQSATPVTIEGQDGYKFTANRFVHISSYNGWLWDEATSSFQDKTGADVYLCWNDDYGTINSEQDLINYANNNATTTYWDIFDASSGAWLNYDGAE